MNTSIKLNNVLVSKILFYIAYTLVLFKVICGEINAVERVSEYITLFEFIMLSICILIQSRTYKVKTVILMTVILTISLCSYTVTKNSNIIILFFFIFAMKNINLERFIKYDIKIKILFLLLNLLLIYIGVLENKVFYRADGSARFALGFASPNSFGGIVLSICLEYVYINRNKINSLMYIKFILVTIMLEFICNSRSSEICLILLIFALILYKRKIYFKKILPYTILIFTIISFIIVYLYGQGNAIALKLDDLFSTRILCAYNFLNLYGINLLGNMFIYDDVWLGYVNTLDNAYMYLLVNQGLLLSLIMIFFNIKLMKNVINDNNKVLVAILLVLSVYGLMERGVFFVTYNVFLLCIKDIIFKYEKISDIRKT